MTSLLRVAIDMDLLVIRKFKFNIKHFKQTLHIVKT